MPLLPHGSGLLASSDAIAIDVHRHRPGGFLFSDLLLGFDQSDQWHGFQFRVGFGFSTSFSSVDGFDFIAWARCHKSLSRAPVS